MMEKNDVDDIMQHRRFPFPGGSFCFSIFSAILAILSFDRARQISAGATLAMVEKEQQLLFYNLIGIGIGRWEDS